ncbi:uncharacterized protein LOC129745689 isoform X1 [Uranotaenia lowii]|uniref:uncharacterized protein LOC129745689 isoform X1 n=1 Tax=Uranotaenia lowii TaxID=190385 RepID=UPI0024799E30|nr:uncharacterized protein LOC129745689 isoform X1 [Uranotaenia lowii]XP_055594943.1 uncharacterized protein LOC129745689 isoform X1 [Uranotaenia lowii]
MNSVTIRRKLNVKAKTLRECLKRAEEFIKKFDAERDAFELPLRLKEIDRVWAAFDDLERQYEEHPYEDNRGNMYSDSDRTFFESKLFEIKAFLLSKMAAPKVTPKMRPMESLTVAFSDLKSPTFALSNFDGNYRAWIAFHDSFLVLVHKNAELSDIQKFHHLRSALKDEAAQVIEAIGFSAENYETAWQTLLNRYSNEYLLKKRHLQDLLEIPRMKTETAACLQSTVNEFRSHIKALEQLGEPIAQWGSMLEHMLCTKLHQDTAKAWAIHAASRNEQSYECLIVFLEDRVRILEYISVNLG